MQLLEFDKINITLIEDNPLQFEDLMSANGEINLSSIDNGLSQHFILSLFQHPVEVKEFIQSFSLLKDNYSDIEIGGFGNIIPDIVVFDYKLSDNLTIDKNPGSIKYNSNSKILREKLNPIYTIKSKLDPLNVKVYPLFDNVKQYRINSFINSISKNGKGTEKFIEIEELGEDEIKAKMPELNDDELGLYCGISIWKMFTHYLTVCIPATQNKNAIEKLHTHSKFYEWLYENDLSEMFLDTNRGDKTWDKILPKAMKHFRARILELAKRNKVSFDLDNLLEILNCTNENQFDNLPLIIVTAYGVKKYHLKALFIGKKENIVDAVINFIKSDILEGILDISDFDTFKKIKTEFNNIWKFYTDKFETVAYLSLLYTESKQNILVEPKSRIFENLKMEFPLNNNKKPSFANPVSVFKANLSDKEKRLLFFCLCIKGVLQFNLNKNVYRISKNKTYYENFEILNDEDFSYITSPLLEEYVNHPYCLEMHIDAVETPNNRFYRTYDSLKKLNIKLDKEKVEKIWLGIITCITPAENSFVKSFFHNEIEKFKSNNLSLPDFLIN